MTSIKLAKFIIIVLLTRPVLGGVLYLEDFRNTINGISHNTGWNSGMVDGSLTPYIQDGTGIQNEFWANSSLPAKGFNNQPVNGMLYNMGAAHYNYSGQNSTLMYTLEVSALGLTVAGLQAFQVDLLKATSKNRLWFGILVGDKWHFSRNTLIPDLEDGIGDPAFYRYLDTCSIASGNGGNGMQGNTGSPGANGLHGSPGENGCEDDSVFCSSCNMPAPGTGGGPIAGTRGGKGGQPGKGNGSGQSGDPGEGPAGAPGTGAATKQNGNPGFDGANGLQGSHGSGGLSFGLALSTGYVPAAGTAGTSGTHAGGGGGGSGTSSCDSYGGAGGDGGSGGHGGGGGGGPCVGILATTSSFSQNGNSISLGSAGLGGIAPNPGSTGLHATVLIQ